MALRWFFLIDGPERKIIKVPEEDVPEFRQSEKREILFEGDSLQSVINQFQKLLEEQSSDSES